ncbi:MAG: TIGR01777 family oxidoreductase [Gemmatimonadales bacterium]|jgi:uncharacterized protein (TIGR01777 family)
MRVFLTGGTGFIGSAVVRGLTKRGDECVVLSRSARSPSPGVTYLEGDPRLPGAWQGALAECDAVVNLAGERLIDPLHPWTESRKAALRRSRVDVTRLVAAAVRGAARAPTVLVSGSAIGYYGDCGEREVDESAPAADDFLGRLAADWEAATREAEPATRVVSIRTGIVLGDGGVFGPLLPLFKLGLGGAWGSGRQWWSWIHLADQVGVILHAIDSEIDGPVNLTAPNPVRVQTFAKALGRVLGRPVLFKAPAFALKLGLGAAAEALLVSQRVLPKRAIETGYPYRFPELQGALADLFGQGSGERDRVNGTRSTAEGTSPHTQS